MKKILLMITFLFLQYTIFSQSNTNRQTETNFPQNGKFEIITSPVTMRHTFMLNRETGDTWQLVSTSNGYQAWKKIDKEKNSDDKIPNGYTGPVYQITLSGISVKGTYLINTLTGATWSLYSDTDTGNLFWGTIYFPNN